ncbi:hypothetical protein UFOVP612_37 [uncultured Caudovirales phage]|uniref:Uncharacterized protein n=1 Tax=uncultured Caudovirales phage TaxID=2100421 RepID=A0A6J5NBQ9_9CAUD|nr:hypothetical protein UFOVP612_37 [uncultured Caudovirales phage]
MASNKGRGQLDKSTRHHLSALDAFIKQQAVEFQPIQPDEFTINDYMQKMRDQGIVIGNTVATRRMKDLMDAGTVTRRKSVKDGKPCNFYRFV